MCVLVIQKQIKIHPACTTSVAQIVLCQGRTDNLEMLYIRPMKGSLNTFMSLGKPWWAEARQTIQRLLSDSEGVLRDDKALQNQVLIPQVKQTPFIVTHIHNTSSLSRVACVKSSYVVASDMWHHGKSQRNLCIFAVPNLCNYIFSAE